MASGLNRRRFLQSAVLGGAAILTGQSSLAGMMGGGGGGGMGGGGMGGGGTTVIDPPIGAAFKDPFVLPNLSMTPGVVEVDLRAQIARLNVNGTRANLMTYNGMFPGPTIRARRGDILKINLTNSLPFTTQTNMLGFQKNLTNLHTHGLHVSPEPPADYMMYALRSGETYNHVYDLAKQDPGALCFYHGHKHGVSAEQYWGGMMGCLDIQDEDDLLSQYETHVMVLKDISLSNGAPAPHSTMMDFMMGKEGNIVMVNGQVNPRLYMKKGQVQRWRIVNASNARFYRLSLSGHTMNLIGTDGGLLDKCYEVGELLLSPGERVDVLVKATQNTGNYKFLALPYSRGSMGGGGGCCGSGTQTVTLLTVTYSGSLTQSLPGTINTGAVKIDPASVMVMGEKTLTLSMGHGRGYINGMDYDVEPCTVMSMVGGWEMWTIVNASGMDHPFHQHVNPAQVISISGGNSNYASLYTSIPAWKDVVIVPAMGNVKLLMPVMDYSGMAMFHCHILEHEDIGMMGMWHLMDGGMEM